VYSLFCYEEQKELDIKIRSKKRTLRKYYRQEPRTQVGGGAGVGSIV
jgi:hypothetical protein